MKLTRRRANVLSYIIFLILLLPLIFVGILTVQNYDTHRYKGWAQMPSEDYLAYQDVFYAVLGQKGDIDKVEDTHYDTGVVFKYDFYVKDGWKEDKALQVLSLEEWGKQLTRADRELPKKALPYAFTFLVIVEAALYIYILKTPKSRLRLEVLDGEEWLTLQDYMNKEDKEK